MKGVATHIGPELCGGIREGVGEASAGEHTGQPLTRENLSNPGADVFVITEGNMRLPDQEEVTWGPHEGEAPGEPTEIAQLPAIHAHSA